MELGFGKKNDHIRHISIQKAYFSPIGMLLQVPSELFGIFGGSDREKRPPKGPRNGRIARFKVQPVL
jgi:hypothetical protein